MTAAVVSPILFDVDRLPRRHVGPRPWKAPPFEKGGRKLLIFFL